jgi:hypothetical protein
MTIDWGQVVTSEAIEAAALVADRSRARALLVSRIDRAAGEITGAVPLAEMLSWAPKEAAARAWLASDATGEQLVLLNGEADITGEGTANLVARIVANADAYRAAIAHLTGLRRNAEAALAAAETPAALEAAYAAAVAAIAAFPN